MKIAIASDHAGFQTKEEIKKLLLAGGHSVEDFGTDKEDSCDYPDFAFALSHAVARSEVERGILVCGSGIGMSIAANKVRGIRAALCKDAECARLSREHNDANVLCVGARTTPAEEIRGIVDMWLDTPFKGGRHLGRVDKISAGEKE